MVAGFRIYPFCLDRLYLDDMGLHMFVGVLQQQRVICRRCLLGFRATVQTRSDTEPWWVIRRCFPCQSATRSPGEAVRPFRARLHLLQQPVLVQSLFPAAHRDEKEGFQANLLPSKWEIREESVPSYCGLYLPYDFQNAKAVAKCSVPYRKQMDHLCHRPLKLSRNPAKSLL